MSEVFYKEQVQQRDGTARIAVVKPRGITLYVVVAGREGRYLGGLEATTKDAWASAYAAMTKAKPGGDARQMGLGL